jgi:hypothetical protein
MTRYETASAAAREEKRRRLVRANARKDTVSMTATLAALVPAAFGLSAAVPSFLPAHPGFWACWTVLVLAYYTVKFAVQDGMGRFRRDYEAGPR